MSRMESSRAASASSDSADTRGILQAFNHERDETVLAQAGKRTQGMLNDFDIFVTKQRLKLGLKIIRKCHRSAERQRACQELPGLARLSRQDRKHHSRSIDILSLPRARKKCNRRRAD